MGGQGPEISERLRNAGGGRSPASLPRRSDAAARDDVGFEPVRTQVGEQFEHRLESRFGEEPAGLRIFRRSDPVVDDLLENAGLAVLLDVMVQSEVQVERDPESIGVAIRRFTGVVLMLIVGLDLGMFADWKCSPQIL